MQVITRFAPSPTGKLHVGNIRTALINMLHAMQHRGLFYLRIDDTDSNKCSEIYSKQIFEDLTWLGFKWDLSFHQKNRIDKYRSALKYLIKIGRVYPCYETPEELDLKRKSLLSRGNPPIYDRSSLRISDKKKKEYEHCGRKPHYRFLLKNKKITWNDLIKQNVSFQGKNLSDPIIVREDGSFTYLLCSTIDDIEYNITDILRGEDHITNTAIQIQMFEALEANIPKFGHLNLIKNKDSKLSKRLSSSSIEELRDNGFLPMSINSFLSYLGSSEPITIHSNLKELVKNFTVKRFTHNSAIYSINELEILNHKLIYQLEYSEVIKDLKKLNIDINENFWCAIRPNIKTLKDIIEWVDIINNEPKYNDSLNWEYLNLSAKLLPESLDNNTWHTWTQRIAKKMNLHGKNLYSPLRIALTGKEHGPELNKLLPLIGYESIIKRLTINMI